MGNYEPARIQEVISEDLQKTASAARLPNVQIDGSFVLFSLR
ncbi:hypothetical protein [uncultured Bacteroides sp.]|nr:hypothetical protein [uncultured Bacteroides sp.]